MSTAVSIPTTLEERLKMGAESLRYPIAYSEFLDLLEQAEYPIEYENGELIIMSIASDEHERIVANLLGVFFAELKRQPDYGRYGSNRHIYIPPLNKAYSPDASVVKGAPTTHEYAKGKAAYTNPWLVTEVISPSSRNRDFGEKLLGYKSIDSLQYILYAEQDRPLVTLFERIPDSNRWRSTDFNELKQKLEIGHFSILMEDIYDNVF
ncbi:MAG: Uma2 family endonuclease [Chitinophagales bacterium]|nr:Uma2 family endonuclease [Chitinophagales bacterium]